MLDSSIHMFLDASPQFTKVIKQILLINAQTM